MEKNINYNTLIIIILILLLFGLFFSKTIKEDINKFYYLSNNILGKNLKVSFDTLCYTWGVI